MAVPHAASRGLLFPQEKPRSMLRGLRAADGIHAYITIQVKARLFGVSYFSAMTLYDKNRKILSHICRTFLTVFSSFFILKSGGSLLFALQALTVSAYSVRLPSCFHVTSLNSGYTNGYSAGKSVAAAKITNIKVSGGKDGQEDAGSKAQGCSSNGYFTIDVSNYSSVVIGNCTIQRANSYVEATLKITTDVGTLLSLSTSGSGTKTGGNVTKALSGASTLKVQITPAVYSNRQSTSSSYGSISSLTFLV
jgi:hypothetical protein